MKYSQIQAYARELRKNQTKAEAFFWSKVRNRQFLGLKFNRQFILEYENSSYFIADFHCYEKRLIVEIDGKIHLKQIEEDQNREDIIKEMGYKILRLKNEEVMNDWEKVEMKLLHQLTPALPNRRTAFKERGRHI